MSEQDLSQTLQAQVQTAYEKKSPLQIVAGRSKDFLGHTVEGDLIDVSQHQGIINYEPTELVLTARSGTLLSDIEKTLAAQNQMLAFEPPHFSDNATLGGTISCNLSGPRRAYAGAARDYVLGTRLINGKGEDLHFGGEVMKNVAGYDVSRLVTGAMGTLGVLLEVSLKVLPLPEFETTLVQTVDAETALSNLHDWALQPLPISASCFNGKQLMIRLSGTSAAVHAAAQKMGGETLENGDAFWQSVREQRHAFFSNEKPLWRLSIASTTPPLSVADEVLYEWGGALRWLKSDLPAEAVQHMALDAGGHATLFRSGKEQNVQRPLEIFQSMPEGLARLNRQIKQAFDPAGILNAGRMYPNI